MDYQSFLNNLDWRYATKKFDSSKKLSLQQLNLIEESLRLAPSSFGIQPWKFYRIDDPVVREEIKKVGYGQAQMSDASHLFVLASKTNFAEKDIDELVKQTASVRGLVESDLQEYKKYMLNSISGKSPEWLNTWCARQVYIALGFGLMAAAQNMIDACPMEGFDAKAVGEIIGAQKDDYEVKAMMAVGFRLADDPYALLKKVRFPKEKVIKII